MRYSTAPIGPRPNAERKTNQKNTPKTCRCAASSACSMTCRSSSVRGSSLASRCSHSLSFWRAEVSSPRSSASRMSVKKWLNCRKPSVRYIRAMSKARASSRLNSRISMYSAPTTRAGPSTDTHHTTQV